MFPTQGGSYNGTSLDALCETMSGAGFVPGVTQGVNKSQYIGLLCAYRFVQHHISCTPQHWIDAKWVNPSSNCIYILSFRIQYQIHVFLFAF